MINWAYFPRTTGIDKISEQVVDIFNEEEDDISSREHQHNSDKVLKLVSPKLLELGFKIEQGKKIKDKIKIPVLFGRNGKTELAFDADAFYEEKRYVIEVEAGRAVTNYQFLKDFFEACMMADVEYLCIAVRNTYRKSKDFEKVYKFFDTMFSSHRVELPLKGILIIGY